MEESTNLGFAVEFCAFLFHPAHAHHVRQQPAGELGIGHSDTSCGLARACRFDGGGVALGQAELAGLQQAPHDLAAAGVRQRIDELDLLGRHRGARASCGHGRAGPAAARRSAAKPSFSETNALTTSPTVGSGLPMTAASATAGMIGQARFPPRTDRSDVPRT